MAIEHIKHKGLKELYLEGSSSKVKTALQANALMILDLLAATHDLRDLQGVKDFHPLKGSRKGIYSMHVNGNYCITFTWNGQDVGDVNLEDYH